MKHITPRLLRGVVAVRADATDPKGAVEALNRAFAEFKTANDAALKGKADVVVAEKVDRINAAVGDLQKAVDAVNANLAAIQVGAGGGTRIDPAVAEYAKAFNAWFRRGTGDEQALKDLAIKAALTTQSDPDGGLTVTPTMESAIDRVLATVSAMRGLARVIRITSNAYKKLVTTSGAASGWVGEEESRPATGTPQLTGLDFPIMEVYANPAATQNLLDDGGVNIEQWLADEVSIEFARQEGDAFINGDGVKKPRGILSYATIANASYAWGKIGYIATGAASAFATANPADTLIDLVHALKAGYRGDARFLMNDTTQATVRKFKDGTGNYLWQPSLQAGESAVLLGKPVVTDDNMPDIGANKYPIAFGNFPAGYVIVDRIGIRVTRDPYTNKPYIQFYTTKRVGGGVQNYEAIKLLKVATS